MIEEGLKCGVERKQGESFKVEVLSEAEFSTSERKYSSTYQECRLSPRCRRQGWDLALILST